VKRHAGTGDMPGPAFQTAAYFACGNKKLFSRVSFPIDIVAPLIKGSKI
jgi:hypothetical protein